VRVFSAVRSLCVCDALALTPAPIPAFIKAPTPRPRRDRLCAVWMPGRRVGTDPSSGRGTQAYVPMAPGTFASLLSQAEKLNMVRSLPSRPAVHSNQPSGLYPFFSFVRGQASTTLSKGYLTYTSNVF
jgi:hypothetical protein